MISLCMGNLVFSKSDILLGNKVNSLKKPKTATAKMTVTTLQLVYNEAFCINFFNIKVISPFTFTDITELI